MTLWEQQLLVAREIIQKNGGLVKTSVLLDAGITYKTILTLTEKGKIVRARSGYYSVPDAVISEEQYIINQFSDCVLTMETGLYYRGYLENRPAEWRIAVSKNISKSRLHIETPRIIAYFSEESALSLGAEEMNIGGKTMQVYSVDRLICDVLKYQDRMSKEQLRSCIHSYIDDENKDIDKLVYYAEKRRIRHKLDNVLGAWIDLPAPEKKKRAVKKSKAKKKEYIQKEEIVFNTLPVNDDYNSSQSTIIIEPKPVLDEPVTVMTNVDTTIEDIQSKPVEIVKEPSPVDLGDIPMAKLCYDIYRQMEMVEDMSIYHRLYTVLTKDNISGRKIKNEIQEICEDNNFNLTSDRLKKIVNWRSDKFMDQKWHSYCKRQDNLSLTWKIVIMKVSMFIIPLGQAIIKKEAFTGDWMPEIGRFLD